MPNKDTIYITKEPLLEALHTLNSIRNQVDQNIHITPDDAQMITAIIHIANSLIRTYLKRGY